MRVILFYCFPFVCVGLATTAGGCWCDRHCCFLVLHLDDKALRLLFPSEYCDVLSDNLR